MQSSPFVSVLVTSFNYEKFLHETLTSLANQTYKNFEVIIVDDGSSDGSVDIIKEYTSKYSNFYFYTHPNNENRGLVESMHLGLSKCKGEYVAFLESDDYWEENYLEVKADYIRKNEDVSILCNKIKTIGSPIRDKAVERYHSVFSKETDKNLFGYFSLENILPTFSAVMIKKSIFESLNFDTPIKPWLDFWLWRQFAFHYNFSYTDETTTYWRIHEQSYIKRTKYGLEHRDILVSASNKLLMKDNLFLFLYLDRYNLVKWIFSLNNEDGYKILILFGKKNKIWKRKERNR